jgi:hypothetical protein
MPYPMVEKDIEEGRLRVVGAGIQSREVDIIMAWRRDSMGEAKAWFLREIVKLLFTQVKDSFQSLTSAIPRRPAAVQRGACRSPKRVSRPCGIVEILRRPNRNDAVRIDGGVAAIIVIADVRQTDRGVTAMPGIW